MADDQRWLVVGLGNPNSEYGGTRHNVGTEVVERLAARHHATLSRNRRVRCEVAEVRDVGRRLVLAVPLSYMNTAGTPVAQAAKWYAVGIDRIIVAHDDLDLDVGVLRLKAGGGHGGHNGLRDLDRALASRDYLRVRLGIGRPPGRQPPRDWVLRRFSPADRERIDVTVEEAADAVEMLVHEGLEPTQNRYHARA